MREELAATWRAEGGGTDVAVVEGPAHLPRRRPGGTSVSSSSRVVNLLFCTQGSIKQGYLLNNVF